MSDFNPLDWYWLADDGRLYSSADRALVTNDKQSHKDWLEHGFMPTRWPEDNDGDQTDASLQLVLTAYGINLAGDVVADVKAGLKVLVDRDAETERLKYITPGTGQAMTYQQKVAEAQAYKAATNPQASDYPILSSEVGITADTLDDVANIVLAAFAQWQQIGAMIESIRLGAKRDIDVAEDEAAARAIVDAVVWPSAQVQA